MKTPVIIMLNGGFISDRGSISRCGKGLDVAVTLSPAIGHYIVEDIHLDKGMIISIIRFNQNGGGSSNFISL